MHRQSEPLGIRAIRNRQRREGNLESILRYAKICLVSDVYCFVGFDSTS